VHRAGNVTPSCAVVMQSGNLNFLEPSGPLQAGNGTAIPLLHLIGVSIIDNCIVVSSSNIVSAP